MVSKEIQHYWNDWLPLALHTTEYYMSFQKGLHPVGEIRGEDGRRLIESRVREMLAYSNREYGGLVPTFRERIKDIDTLSKEEFEAKYDLDRNVAAQLDVLADQVNESIKRAVSGEVQFEWKKYHTACLQAASLMFGPERQTFLHDFYPIKD